MIATRNSFVAIKSVNEIVREYVESAVNSAKKKYNRAVMPIYGQDEMERLYHIGTCFLLEYRHEKYLITAAHVIDDSEKTPLRVMGWGKSVEVSGDFYLTHAPK